MEPIDLEVSESINGICVRLHVSYSPRALSSAFPDSAVAVAGDEHEYLAALVLSAMRTRLPELRDEAVGNLLKASNDVLSEKLSAGKAA